MFDILLGITYVAAVAMSLYTAVWLFLKADRNRITGAFIACQLLIVVWCIPQLFLGIVRTQAGLYLAYAVSYVGICLIGPAWLTFALLYGQRRIPRWGAALLWALPLFHYAMLLTNGAHHLFYARFAVGDVVYGPVFYLHVVFTYACVVAGMAAVARNFRRRKVRALHIGLILVSVAVPLLFNLLHISGVVRTGFDLTPPAFSVSCLLMLLAVYRYDFLNVNPMAFRQILAELPEAVLVYNERGRITYANAAAGAWFGVETGDELKKFEDAVGRLEETLQAERSGQAEWSGQPEWSGQSEWAGQTEQIRQLERAGQSHSSSKISPISPQSPLTAKNYNTVVRSAGHFLEIRSQTHLDQKGQFLAGTVLAADVSRHYELRERERELAEADRSLAVERERNRIAQEVHDTTGHTLTMINSLLKLARIGQKAGDDGEVAGCLAQAEELAAGGIRELRCSINNLKAMGNEKLVSRAVRELAETVREFEVEVTVQGADSSRYSHLTPVVQRCFKEALTNCLKYAGATHMDAILKFSGDSLSFYVFDNGRGCGEIKRGNGLEGIYRRVEEAGGQVRVASEEGAGFQMTIRLPVESEGDSQ